RGQPTASRPLRRPPGRVRRRWTWPRGPPRLWPAKIRTAGSPANSEASASLRRYRPGGRGPRMHRMFDEKLPYRVFDADNHFYEPAGILEKYLESKFHDRVAVDYTPEKAAQHNAKIRAELEQRKKEGGLIPGMALNKMNPLRDKSAEERARIVEEFRAL